jgi:RNA polymerase sigma-70 factor, ECF subfamily
MTPPEPGPVAPADEQALVARAQRGEMEAFESLYRSSAGRVFAVCLRMCGDRERATELLQDIFVRVWERLGSFRGESAFATWVHRLAINVVLETARKDQRREARITPADIDESNEPSDDRFARSVETRLDLDRALRVLPPGARRAFVLHDVEGYRHEEIARMLDVAEGTVRAQLHRARKLLMEALDR